MPDPNTITANTLVDSSVQSSIVTGMSFAAAQLNTGLIGCFNMLAQGASSMWQIALTTPTQQNSLALQTAKEAGSGRTRLEANRPAETSAAGPLPPG